MKYFTIAAGLLSLGLTQAQKVSNDGSCGGSGSISCQGSEFGNCCSQYGWCGSSTGHCGTGCQSKFGTCSGSNPITSTKRTSSTLVVRTSTRASSAVASTPTKKVSTDATCGSTNGGATCLGSSFGNCCSSSGWCGSTSAYCGTGCQSGFGDCQGSVKPSSTVKTSSSTAAQPTPSASGSQTALQCLNGKDVPYKMTLDAEFPDLIEPYNTRLPFTPAVVVLPTTNQHVQDAVVCAAQAGLKVQAKSGGHSYSSNGLGGIDGSMSINLQSFQTIQLDQSSGVATVGGGVRLGNLADGLWNQGKASVSHGTCPGVGIGGHYTHGGYSHTSRNYGLAMDQVVAADVVLANGTLIKATSTAYPDIFWAIRGAADSFGIVTTFYLQTRPAPSSITNFQFPLNGVFDSKAKFTNTFQHLQDVAKNASVIDNKVSFGVYLDGYGTFSLSGAYFGSVADFNSKVKPELLRGLPSSTSTVESLSWYEFNVKVSGESTIKTPVTGYDKHEDFFAKSVTVPESDGLTANTMNALYDYLKTANGVEYYMIINLYGGPGSAINAKDTNFAAYNDRDSLWVLQNYGYGAGSINFVNGINNAIINAQPQTKFGAYLNYIDPSYDAATAHKVYYGDVVYSRLAALKKQVDPQSVFWHPQAIGA